MLYNTEMLNEYLLKQEAIITKRERLLEELKGWKKIVAQLKPALERVNDNIVSTRTNKQIIQDYEQLILDYETAFNEIDKEYQKIDQKKLATLKDLMEHQKELAMIVEEIEKISTLADQEKLNNLGELRDKLIMQIKKEYNEVVNDYVYNKILADQLLAEMGSESYYVVLNAYKKQALAILKEESKNKKAIAIKENQYQIPKALVGNFLSALAMIKKIQRENNLPEDEEFLAKLKIYQKPSTLSAHEEPIKGAEYVSLIPDENNFVYPKHVVDSNQITSYSDEKKRIIDQKELRDHINNTLEVSSYTDQEERKKDFEDWQKTLHKNSDFENQPLALPAHKEPLALPPHEEVKDPLKITGIKKSKDKKKLRINLREKLVILATSLVMLLTALGYYMSVNTNNYPQQDIIDQIEDKTLDDLDLAIGTKFTVEPTATIHNDMYAATNEQNGEKSYISEASQRVIQGVTVRYNGELKMVTSQEELNKYLAAGAEITAVRSMNTLSEEAKKEKSKVEGYYNLEEIKLAPAEETKGR